ncbi:DUF732 domain-containing protein [Nocardia sp. SYP-A9097]|uniref:DUF732 domain-containing protein n=1 Tax=Nocardia sp. SYP-A9097 TaxID=2663237 RepID=UPI00129BABCC|nr:DUF732 domain-containing protein [Nocardia sp. SYP-A9097]MRH86137.1 DUF732 domain-containing protein [Nocardia sp. SYP-A9097]
MYRTRNRIIGVLAACAAAALLTACGSDDSTATSTSRATVTSAAGATSAPSAVLTTSAAPTTESAQPSTTEPDPGASVSSERPAPVPTQFLPTDTPALTDKDKAYLAALAKRGITPAMPQTAVSAGTMVCQGKSGGASQDQILTFVDAIAGSDPNFEQLGMPVDQVGKIYYEVAIASYCDK